MTTLMLASAAVILVVAPVRMRLPGAFTAIGAVLHPLVGCAVASGWWMVRRSRSIATQRRDARSQRDGAVVALEMVATGLTAGVPFDAAVEETARHVDTAVSTELMTALRRARYGVEPMDGSLVAQMIRLFIDAEASGAAPAAQIAQLADRERNAMDALLDRRLQRLPVAMLFPLALLILPGFLLVSVAPALIGGISRLGL